jgi:hypothetical protein
VTFVKGFLAVHNSVSYDEHQQALFDVDDRLVL